MFHGEVETLGKDTLGKCSAKTHTLTCVDMYQIMYIYTPIPTWVFPKIEVPQNGWFIMDKMIKMDDLGVPSFKETPTCIPKI